MSDSDLTLSIADTLYEHRLAKSSMKTRDWTFFCTCFGWSTSTTVTHGHAHQEWIHHIASVLSGVYAITPLPKRESAEFAHCDICGTRFDALPGDMIYTSDGIYHSFCFENRRSGLVRFDANPTPDGGQCMERWNDIRCRLDYGHPGHHVWPWADRARARETPQ